MSNGFAIAAVSATLRQLLIDRLGITDVTTRPLDKAREGLAGDQVNLFLYHAQVEGGWRNMDMPRQLKPGESGHPPLPLSLHYLLTAFNDEKDEVKAHMLLGRAMAVFHDHPLLDASEIQSATVVNVPESNLHDQIERVRITFQPLSLEEISKLWSAFQTQYRTSAAYQVSVVLIESERPAKAPLPVLKRGKDDTGVTSQPDLIPPFPTLTDLELPDGQAAARLGEDVVLTGHHLDAGTLEVRVSHPHLTDPAPVTVQNRTATSVRFTLDDADPSKWAAGIHAVSCVITDGGDVRSTNEIGLPVAPLITTALPLDVARDASQDAEITLSFSPEFQPGQRAAVLIGGREVAAETPAAAPTDTLTFIARKAPLGEHFLRLRIDGVDSLLVQRPPGQPPVFDATQKVTIHD